MDRDNDAAFAELHAFFAAAPGPSPSLPRKAVASLPGSARFHIGAAVNVLRTVGADKFFAEDGTPLDPKGERWQMLLPSLCSDLDGDGAAGRRGLAAALAQRLATLGVPYYLRATQPPGAAANGDALGGPRAKRTRLAPPDAPTDALRPDAAGTAEQPAAGGLPPDSAASGATVAALAMPHSAPLDVPALVVEPHGGPGQLFTGMLGEPGAFGAPGGPPDGAFGAELGAAGGAVGLGAYGAEGGGPGTGAGGSGGKKNAAVAQQTCPDCGLKQPARRNTCAAEGCFYNFKAAREAKEVAKSAQLLERAPISFSKAVDKAFACLTKLSHQCPGFTAALFCSAIPDCASPDVVHRHKGLGASGDEFVMEHSGEWALAVETFAEKQVPWLTGWSCMGLQRKARTLKNFLDELKLGELLELFELHQFTVDGLPHISEFQLQAAGVPVGAWGSIINAAQRLREAQGLPPQGLPPA